MNKFLKDHMFVILFSWLLIFTLALIVLFIKIADETDNNREKAKSVATNSCDYWFSVASAKISNPATEFELQVIASARIAYHQQNCQSIIHEPLSEPDPRILPYLPEDMHN